MLDLAGSQVDFLECCREIGAVPNQSREICESQTELAGLLLCSSPYPVIVLLEGFTHESAQIS